MQRIWKSIISLIFVSAICYMRVFCVEAEEMGAEKQIYYEKNISGNTAEYQNANEWSVEQDNDNKWILTVYSDSAMSGEGVKEWDSYKDTVNEIVIEPGVTYIGKNAFKDFGMLGKITIPDSVVEIQESAFEGCYCLTDIDIPTGIKHIFPNTFKGCYYLKEFRLPKELEVIDQGAFLGCDTLDYLMVPKTIVEIDDYSIGMKYDEVSGQYKVVESFILYGYNDVAKNYAQKNGIKYIDLRKTEETEYWSQYTSYYYYEQLTEKEKIVWNELEDVCYQIMISDEDFEKGINLKINDIYSMEKNEWADFYNLFRISHPQFFFLSNISVMEEDERTPVVGGFEVYDKFQKGKDREAATTEFKNQLEDWYTKISLGDTEEEKIRIITGIICQDIMNESYDSYYSQGSWDAVCSKKTSGTGYALTTQLLCMRAEIESVPVMSEFLLFNIVKVNDKWFNLYVVGMDNDGISDDASICENMNWNKYYLVSDADLATSTDFQPKKMYTSFVIPSCLETYDKHVILDNPHVIGLISEVAATCLKDGKTEGKYCKVCSKIFEESKVISATGHKWDTGVVVQEATEIKDGLKLYKCINEGCQETKTEVIPKGVDLSIRKKFILCGMAQRENESITLTNTDQYVSGGAYSVMPISLQDNFELSFDFFMDGGNAHSFQGNGADGITVSFSPKKPGVLGTGGNIAFAGKGSFGVQYDTWWNYQDRDIQYDHIAIIKNNANNHVAYKNFPDMQLDDGKWHSTTIRYTDSELQVYLDDELMCKCERKQVFDMASAYICISASTGSFVNNHLIKNVSIKGSEIDICGYTRNKFQTLKEFNGQLVFSNAWVEETKSENVFHVQVSNVSEEDYSANKCNIIFYDKNGKQVIFDSGIDEILIHIETIKAGDTITLSVPLGETADAIYDYKIDLNTIITYRNYIKDNHNYFGLDFIDGEVIEKENKYYFDVTVENNANTYFSGLAAVIKFFGQDAKWICNIESYIPALAPEEKSRISIALPDDIYNLYDYLVVQKGLENQSYNFDIDLYRASILDDVSNPTSSAWNKMIKSEGPTSVLLSSLDDSSFGSWVGAWKLLQDVGSKINKGTSNYEIVLKQKDIYAALILDILQKESEQSDSGELIKKIDSNSKKIIGFMKEDGRLTNMSDFMDGKNFEQIKWKSLTSQEQKNFMDSFKEAYKKAHPGISTADKVISGIHIGVQTGETLKDCIEYIESYVELYSMSETQKDIVHQMYLQCSGSNPELKVALLECDSILSASNEEFCRQMINGTCVIAGRKLASAWSDVLWGILMDEVKISHPYVAMYLYSFEMSSYATNILYNVDDISEKYYCMVAMQEMRELVEKVYDRYVSDYKQNQSVFNAQHYLAAADILYKVIDTDCGYAKKFVSSVDGGWVAKLQNYLGDKKLEEKIKDIEFIQKQDELIYKRMLIGWIYGLESDYPEEYIRYRKYLEDQNFTLSKLYKIACPVDIYVYDINNNLVGSVIDNNPAVYTDGLEIAVKNDEKQVYFYNDKKEYTIVYNGTADGKMDIQISEYLDGSVREIQFNRMRLDASAQYISEVKTDSNELETPVIKDFDNKTYVADYDSIKVDSINSSINLKVINGYVLKNEDTFSNCMIGRNERIRVCAIVPENKRFVRWEIISNDVEKKAYITDETSMSTVLYTGDSDCIITAVLEEIQQKDDDKKDNTINEKKETITDSRENELKRTEDSTRENAKNDIKVTKIKISAPSHKLAVGKKVKLKASVIPGNATNKKVKWKVNNRKYAKIDKNGRLILKKAGVGKTIIITANSGDESGIKGIYKIKVMKDAVKSIKISVPQKSLKGGKHMKLKVDVKCTGKNVNNKLKWSVSNEKYATVSKNGVIKAKKAGKGKVVRIVATSTDGSNKKASIKIKIK